MLERERQGLAGRRVVRWLAALWLCASGGLVPAPAALGLGADTELAYFEATSLENGVVTLEWGTISEAGAVGFRVYRSTAVDGYRAPIAWEAAVGAPSTPTTYAITDTLAVDTTYWYWLADINTSGVEQALTTPISVSTGLRPVELPMLHRVYLNLILR